MKKKLTTLLFFALSAALVVVLGIYTYLGVRPSHIDQSETVYTGLIMGMIVLLAVGIGAFVLLAARRFCGKH